MQPSSKQSLEDSTGLDAWRANIARSFVPMEVMATSNTPQDFHASVERHQCSFLALSRVKADAHLAIRTDKNLNLQVADYYKLSFQLAGATVLTQDGRQCVLHPGEFAINDTTRTFQVETPDHGDFLVVQFPRDELMVDTAVTSSLTAHVLSDTPWLGTYLNSVVEMMAQESLPAANARHRFARSIVELIAASLLSHYASPSDASSSETLLFDSIKRYSVAHLADASLTVEDVATANFVSTRTLQRLFSAQGTSFNTWLRGVRLERAYTRITTSDVPVTTIALESGFASPAHFSRSFRQRFGCAARELRSGRVGPGTL